MYAFSIDSVDMGCFVPANTKHLYNIYTTSAQRRRRWAGVAQILYKCFVFAGLLQKTVKGSNWKQILPFGLIPCVYPLWTVWTHDVFPYNVMIMKCAVWLDTVHVII